MNSKTGYKTTIQIRILASLLAKLAKKDLEARLEKSGKKITTVQYNVVRLLYTKAYTLTELANKLFIEPASLIPVIDDLEKRKLVVRSQDVNDRRKAPLVLQKRAAQSLLSIPLVASQDSMVSALRHIGARKSQQALTLLREIVDYMNKDKEILKEISLVQK